MYTRSCKINLDFLIITVSLKSVILQTGEGSHSTMRVLISLPQSVKGYLDFFQDLYLIWFMYILL